MGSINSDWQTIVAAKQKKSQSLIPEAWKIPESIKKELKYPLEENANRILDLDIPKRSGILSEREVEITESNTVAELLSKLASGAYTSLEVATAFCKRAAIAQQLVSCLTETFFDQAIARAKELDQAKADGKPLGPLHGLPISMKDGFQIKGLEASIGYVSFLGKLSEANSPLVDVLLGAGAVLYCKTNIPMTLMTADSHNNIFGRALNPHNTALNAGGSSGGEGALVAMRGSPIGVGTDVAGSIRIPSLCCGTYGFKPTSSRIPYGGQAIPGLPGFKPIVASAGPLANDFEALEIFAKAVIDSTPALLDSTALDVPWRTLKPITNSRLRFGVLPADPLYPLHPPVKRALEEAVKLIQAQGHEIVHLDVGETRVADACELSFELFTLTPGAAMGHLKASGEPPVPSVLAQTATANHGKYKFIPDFKHLDKLHEYAALSVKRQEYTEDWRKLWNHHKLDAIIAPAAQNTAVPHDTFGWPPYTVLFNVLDFPSVVMPFSKASKEIDSEPFQPQPGQAGTSYIPELFDGAPVSIQVATTRMRDEEVINISRVVDSILNKA
ncbi:hypothetical protein PV10_00268 [Exophiala mesophila]|uniref:amidase n=1 Tax=Exophiala mesophila TaxID=212818 RepID=A0A0D1X3J8_EXOME|nr:uncharacterized protein PV10_00268 [Exophiala mesophila]KIV96390.1 hypothetical protein PV10_00268 [Exophiala mesophila]